MENKSNKRELILAAAQEIFFEKGYHGATSEEIAKKAGIGKGTIYQYFNSKSDIFLEMHRLYIERYGNEVAALVQPENSFAENLREIVHFHISNLKNLSQYCLRFMMDMPPASMSKDEGLAIVEQAQKRLNGIMERTVLYGQQRGEIRAMDVQMAIYYMVGIFFGMAHLIGFKEISDDEAAKLEEQVIEMILHGLSDNTAEA